MEIPGFGELRIKYFVMDYNGTLAIDGKLSDETKVLLNKLSEKIEIHIITADTFGMAKKGLKGVKCKLTILSGENQAEKKGEYIKKLGKEFTIAFGNGRNDRFMVKEARLGIALLQEEGGAVETLLNSDIIIKDIIDGLSMFMNIKRVIATLRS
jgi:P-type E1-E2 ATPase